MGYAALAEVMGGWTGSISVTVGASAVTVTPRRRESVASIFAQLILRVYAELGLEMAMAGTYNGAFPRFTISASASFDMSVSGNCSERCDFDSGPYSGASSYNSDANISAGGVLVPTYGLRLDDPGIASRGRVVADGSAASMLSPSSPGSRLVLITTILQAAAIEAAVAAWSQDQQVHDVWHDGRLVGRVRFDGAPSRRPIARAHGLSTSAVELSFPVAAVRE